MRLTQAAIVDDFSLPFFTEEATPSSLTIAIVDSTFGPFKCLVTFPIRTLFGWSTKDPYLLLWATTGKWDAHMVIDKAG
jgi:hypothetical protein